LTPATIAFVSSTGGVAHAVTPIITPAAIQARAAKDAHLRFKTLSPATANKAFAAPAFGRLDLGGHAHTNPVSIRAVVFR